MFGIISFLNRINSLLATEAGLTIAIIFGSFLLSFVVVIIVLLAMRDRTDEFRQKGTQARAVVQSLEMTGTRINHIIVYKIEVEVFPDDGPSFKTILRRQVPPHETNFVQPGQTVTVHYMPENPQKKIMITSYGWAGDQLQLEELDALLDQQQAEHHRLNQEGLAAKAMVIELEDLGHRVNDVGAVCQMRLAIFGTDGAPYEATILLVIHQERLGRYSSGMSVPVRVDPDIPTKVAIDESGVKTYVSHPGEDPLAAN